ncbi:MAG: ParA family protein [Candidatus Thiodiazotropha endolucinida]|nr:ParA family protein [Candidatus Thiodiazotropha taylori]MCW4263904.1 ParA family protein [Candidatus Thiodiazotropha endolucinida]MCG7953743.1 ParA family protein [Candidatus Thiodiazotropha taylori]MCG8102525.1 ParA family protein [Candidatus Thiodiazotropha taylori]MCG8119965.1 ParA family protein [Candidatus Thiodiazotropha taylori]
MKRLLILNSKGGCGKTTIATNLAGFYAASGTSTALFDYDPQGSSKRWLELRPDQFPDISGVFAAKTTQGSITRSFALRVPPDTQRIIVDTPASMKRLEMMEMLRSATAVVVPVLPSGIDCHVTLDFLKQLSDLVRQMGLNIPIGIVANRVRINTRSFKKLKASLEELNVPLVAFLRESQNYVYAAESGYAVVDLKQPAFKKDNQQWSILINWLETGQLQPSIPPSNKETQHVVNLQ